MFICHLNSFFCKLFIHSISVFNSIVVFSEEPLHFYPLAWAPSLMNKVPLTVNWLWPHSDRDSIEKHLGSSEVIPEDPVDMQGSSPCLLSADPYCDPAPNRGYAGSKAVVRCSETLNSSEWLWSGKTTTKTRAKGRHWMQTPLYSF